MADTDTTEFCKWLTGRDYQTTTVKSYGAALRRAMRNKDPTKILRQGGLPSGTRTQIVASLKLYAEFVGGGAGDAILERLRSLPRYRPRHEAPERPLTDDEWRALKARASEEEAPVGPVLRLLCTTGLRVGSDLGRIERKRAEEALETDVLYLKTKGGHYRAYPAQDIKGDLRALLEFEGWQILWQAVTGTSKEAYYMAIVRALRRCAKDVGLDPKKMHPHILRKTRATQLLKMTGGDIVVVQKLMGHADIGTTQRYVGYTDPDELADVMGRLNKQLEDD